MNIDLSKLDLESCLKLRRDLFDRIEYLRAIQTKIPDESFKKTDIGSFVFCNNTAVLNGDAYYGYDNGMTDIDVHGSTETINKTIEKYKFTHIYYKQYE